VRGLIRDKRYDTTCPVCGKYAVHVPLADGPLTFVGDAEGGKQDFRCIDGHKGP
jgi:ssDNA-binding Zn-finger/Zn-ribbon topoisomerase 1